MQAAFFSFGAVSSRCRQDDVSVRYNCTDLHFPASSFARHQIMLQRLFPLVMVSALCGVGTLSLATPAVAQTDPLHVYRCPDNTYTNDLSEVRAKNCKLIDNANVSILSAPGMAPKTLGPAGRRASSPNETERVAPATQKQRDAEARQILETELQHQQAKLAQLLKDYDNGHPPYQADERIVGGGVKRQQYLDRVASMRNEIAMTQANIAALQRELQKYPQ